MPAPLDPADVADPPPRSANDHIGFRAELRDAVAPRTVLLMFGVLLLQLGFIFSYVAAFHAPRPHRIPVAIVAPDTIAPQLVHQINNLAGGDFRAHASPSAGAAETAIRSGSTSAALIVNPAGTTDRLLIASGGGVAVAGAVQLLATRIKATRHRTVRTSDIVPLQPGDARGLTGFYLVVGWIVGGYLVAAMLGIAGGARPATTSRAIIRLLAIIPYAVLSGLGGALIVDQALGALTGHLVALWGLGALVVAASAVATMAFQVLFGVLGIGIVILAFVVLGNPSAGGAYQATLLPGFWRTISTWLPNGAGTDSVRRIVYFDSHGISLHIAVLAAYVIARDARDARDARGLAAQSRGGARRNLRFERGAAGDASGDDTRRQPR